MKRKTESRCYHYEWGLGLREIFKGLIIFLLVVMLINLITNESTKNEMFYNTCADACSKKNFMGIEVGLDDWTTQGKYVNEFDRTNCIASCNTAYLLLRQEAR